MGGQRTPDSQVADRRKITAMRVMGRSPLIEEPTEVAVMLVPIDLAGPAELQAADAAVAALQAESQALPAVMDAAYEANDPDRLVAANARAAALPLVIRQARQAALALRLPHLDTERERQAESSRRLIAARDALQAQVTDLQRRLADLQGPIAEAEGRYGYLSRLLADGRREQAALRSLRRV